MTFPAAFSWFCKVCPSSLNVASCTTVHSPSSSCTALVQGSPTFYPFTLTNLNWISEKKDALLRPVPLPLLPTAQGPITYIGPRTERSSWLLLLNKIKNQLFKIKSNCSFVNSLMSEVLNCVVKNQACDGKIIYPQKISPLPSCKTFWFPKQDRDGVGSKQTKTSGVFFQLEPLLTRATYKSWNMWWDVTGCQIEMR